MKIDEIRFFASDLGIKVISGSINLRGWKEKYLDSHGLDPFKYDMSIEVFNEYENDVLIVLKRK